LWKSKLTGAQIGAEKLELVQCERSNGSNRHLPAFTQDQVIIFFHFLTSHLLSILLCFFSNGGDKIRN